MVTILNYIVNNDNTRVRLHKKESKDPYDAYYEILWEGMLKEIPEEYHNLEVIQSGWSYNSLIENNGILPLHCLEVYVPKKKRYLADIIDEIVAARNTNTDDVKNNKSGSERERERVRDYVI